ncbi:MAG TPA: hypothetical protein V6C57_10940 [Coleofasciculaceae cyanobacterium]
MASSPSESSIQSKLIKQYRAAGYYVIKLGITNKGGLPDLLLIKDGIASFIEVKKPGCHPTPLQLHRADELRAIGCVVRFVTEGDRDIEGVKTGDRALAAEWRGKD